MVDLNVFLGCSFEFNINIKKPLRIDLLIGGRSNISRKFTCYYLQ